MSRTPERPIRIDLDVNSIRRTDITIWNYETKLRELRRTDPHALLLIEVDNGDEVADEFDGPDFPPRFSQVAPSAAALIAPQLGDLHWTPVNRHFLGEAVYLAAGCDDRRLVAYVHEPDGDEVRLAPVKNPLVITRSSSDDESARAADFRARQEARSLGVNLDSRTRDRAVA
jgi:hypothetical protein